MRKALPLFVLAAALSSPAWAQKAPAAASAAAPEPTAAQVLTAFRMDLQAVRADVLAKNLTLTADQAARFWPLFEKFQAEQNVIIDEQLKNIQNYAEKYRTLTDADALALMNAQLDRDAKMNALRTRWLAEFQKVLPVKDAVRVIQIDRRLGNATQVQLSARIPLVP